MKAELKFALIEFGGPHAETTTITGMWEMLK